MHAIVVSLKHFQLIQNYYSNNALSMDVKKIDRRYDLMIDASSILFLCQLFDYLVKI